MDWPTTDFPSTAAFFEYFPRYFTAIAIGVSVLTVLRDLERVRRFSQARGNMAAAVLPGVIPEGSPIRRTVTLPACY